MSDRVVRLDPRTEPADRNLMPAEHQYRLVKFDERPMARYGRFANHGQFHRQVEAARLSGFQRPLR